MEKSLQRRTPSRLRPRGGAGCGPAGHGRGGGGRRLPGAVGARYVSAVSTPRPDELILTVPQAVARLCAGDVVAIPTETVYGLAADAGSPLAVRRIFAAKGRPADHPLIVHLAATEDPAAALAGWALPDPRAERLVRACWPGPLTVILPRAPGVPDEVTGGRDTVGLRMPDHAVAQQILAAFAATVDGPAGLAAPSANRFGRVSPTTAAHVRAELPEVPVVDGGPCAVGVESTIVDLSGPVAAVLRPGAVSAERVAALVGPLGGPTGTAAPGTLASHYAPHTALLIDPDPDAAAARLRAEGRSVAVLPSRPPADYARLLYAELRRLDEAGVDVLIAAPADDDDGLGRAVNDRLQRAAHGSG
ncbi:MAG: threonylcarbamoyl-AMP synthase [Alphaproteobacteria bacterium]|nr:threonylcarbamoyl-AMP synthase [Alphaproteobacteria bacterium]